MVDGLTLRDNARADLMQIKSIEDGVTYLNKLESVAIWVMKEKKDAELSILLSEQRLRTQRILGELIKSGQNSGGIATAGNPDKFNSANREELKPSKIDEIGLTHKQSSNYKQMAEIPDDKFEEFIQKGKDKVNEAVKELTTAGAVRLAKTLKEKREDLDTLRDINGRLDTERELRNLAGELRKKYDREQIEMLIKFLTK
jgi:DNA-binding transcriptional ArsR family regulator